MPTDRSAISRYPLLAGPLLALVFGLGMDLEPGHPRVTLTAAMAIWMVVWWVFEAVPLAVTAMLPMVVFPLAGVLSGKVVAPLYFNHIVFLFIGGFLVAIAMQRWALHRRLALGILLLIGTSPRRLLFGFMAATAFLSMWISNTATAMLMVPICLAVVSGIEGEAGEGPAAPMATALLLGVAYAASIGGIATLVGTPPNLSFVRILTISFPEAPEIAFSTWMAFALPLSLGLLVIAWAWLAGAFLRGLPASLGSRELIRGELVQLGPMRPEERSVLVVFVLLAGLWVTRADLRLGGVVLPGWSGLFAHPAWINDGVVAMAMAALLFVLPSRQATGRLLDASAIREIPWDIVLLFGGGFALAYAIKDSGLAAWIAGQMSVFEGASPWVIVAVLCLLATFLTEVTSNTATTEMLLPIVAATAVGIGANPLLLMVPVTLSCSLAFMMPVATPPNAIIFGSGRVRIADMARTGLVLNLIGVVLVTAMVYLLGPIVFDQGLLHLPDWARP